MRNPRSIETPEARKLRLEENERKDRAAANAVDDELERRVRENIAEFGA